MRSKCYEILFDDQLIDRVGSKELANRIANDFCQDFRRRYIDSWKPGRSGPNPSELESWLDDVLVVEREYEFIEEEIE